ncbi:MAG: TonB-dependent receptor plug domain-containing protein, partial [Kangiellaceae bacterium]|nr:TonB-dependent receptor plug domain-containing protein [Kangiellaceae bacterium]
MNNFNSKLLARAVRVALVAGTAASIAMPSVYAAEDEAASEKVTVTGSRIKRSDVETSSPVTVITQEDIASFGFTRIEDLLNNLPQIETAQNAFTVNGSSGTATLDLRGLGANRTLVLINGRRVQAGGIYTQSADINQIPASMVERIEIMTGGGASVYGADAVAGVVNFIIRDNFEGVEVNVSATGYQHNNDNNYIQRLMDNRGFEYPTGDSGIDGQQQTVSFMVGGDFADGKGNATAYATYRNVEALLQGARDYSSCALNNAGTACGGSANT